ncbi:PLP-dependent aminotransferase family protein [Miltoncostaea marina]|uniref:aminotransferase-like domain-containing protein n=1 Tax=Miltoncostaea marina TaxID=2843215 RepID=UPI001C3DBCFA|nr:PLP-dependent aminotransferase family protein [Miltoncostaea marina]
MPTTISFARGAPHPDALSGDLIAECTRLALEADATRILSYGTGNGYPPLREVLASWHGAEPGQVLITNGSLQGFVFLLESHLRPGDVVAVESPTYDRALLQLKLHGMDVLPIPLDGDGMDVEALAASCAAGRTPRLLYTIPNFQNPSGATLSAERRARLVEVCEEYDILIVEDDPYGRLRFEGEDLPGIWRIAPPGRVIFTSSFSKTVAPGLRVGYLVSPPEIAGDLAAAASRTYISPALLSEAAIHQLIVTDRLEPNIAHVTELMRERRDAMSAGMRHMPEGTAYVPPQGGFFCWLTLPEGLSADELFEPAAAAGIAYVKGSDCVLGGGERTLRLAYSGVSPAEIEEGMERLGAVFSAAAVTS